MKSYFFAIYSALKLTLPALLVLYDDGTLIARSSVSTGVQGHPYPPRRVQRHRQGTLASLQHLQRSPHALHAADHLVRVSRSMPASCPGIRHHTAAFAWQRTSPFDCGI